MPKPKPTQTRRAKRVSKEITKSQLIDKLQVLDLGGDKKKRNSVVCSLIGHSNIQTGFFGYIYCGRCGDQVGDTLGGVYSNEKSVMVGHNCKTCRKNYKKLTWKDKLYAPTNPLKEKP